MGLKTQVKILKGKFDAKAYCKSNNTNAVAVIGKKDAVIKSIEGFNKSFAKEVSGYPIWKIWLRNFANIY